MKIKDVSVRHADRSIWGHLAEREKTLPLVTPLDIYPQFQETRGSWFWDSGMAVVHIETADGIIGVGWCEDGCRAVAPDPCVTQWVKRAGSGIILRSANAKAGPSARAWGQT